MKKIFNFSTAILLYSLFTMSFNVLSAERKAPTQEQLISQVETLFRKDAETLNYDEVVELSNKIILQREKYPNETLAKTYLLLANVASNKGEIETAYQFTQDGLAITTGHEKVKLCLQIKLASILSAKYQYEQLFKVAQQALNMPHDVNDIKYLLFASKCCICNVKST